MNEIAVGLDLEAQKLYEQFQGLEDSKQFYVSEQQQLNGWRTSMIEFAYLLARTLNNYRVSEAFEKDEENFRPLLNRLNRMLEIPQRTSEHKLTIRHRGLGLVHQQTDKDNDETKFDYVISCGDCVIDKPYIEYLVKNKIIDDPALLGKLNKAFQFFALTNIYTIEINLNDWGAGNEQIINSCLMFWARYINELAKDTNQVVRNESNEPDPNLTILARLNRLKLQDVEKLIRQIHTHFMS
ncbi:MAG: hypothetical protein Q7U02_05280 [Desulfosalsimonadaceae bacterium]|nr:hypothetical protein [Desulfosalsimonadaceae bacterium]